ncbi:translocation/assembly module TamB domain-containing protein [Paraburkholderia adhaesiva]|uniref:translocation/assembly module TamB domain-containing protein n=1 Tax=Paraburkholderia adhaesiva TaxID=2883244 RepID=UPI001F241791|nr:translocation/assembly module TamB domain-containing protein [Paraburkholderia adhaesiva]
MSARFVIRLLAPAVAALDAPTPGAGVPPEGPPPADPGGGDGPPAPPPRRPHRIWHSLVWAVAAPVLIVALAVGLLYGAVTTERGTALVWRAAVKVLGGQLAGTLDGGTLATGLQLRNVSWRGADGTTFAVDHASGKWALSSRPWHFVVDYLHIGDVDLRIVPSTEPSTPMTLPKDLQLPLALDIRDLRVAKLTLHQGASTTEFSRFAFHARSDGRHHAATVEQLDTPFGAVSASAKLDGVRPFPLSGELGYAGKVNNEDVQVNGRIGGTLEALTADLDATGMKLAGRAHIEAAPFEAVPLERATLAFDHVNPQAFAPGAPFADLAVRADLKPVDSTAGGADSGGAASTHAPAPHTSANNRAAGFTVAGNVSIVNAKPGAIDANLLPLVSARTDVVLDAHTQRLANLDVRLVKDATLTGGGTISGRNGRFDLKVARLDLNAFEARVRPTQLAGPITVHLAGDVQSITLDLADPQAALRAQGKVTFDPARLSLSDVRVTSGAGRIDLSGAIKHDANSTYTLKAAMTDFDPLSLTSQVPSRAAARPSTAAQGAARNRPVHAAGSDAPSLAQAPAQADAQNTAHNTTQNGTSTSSPVPRAAPRRIEARVNGTIDASGTLAPAFTTRAQFRLGPSVYDDLPLTGEGIVQLAGSRILPSQAHLSVAGNDVALQGSFGAPGDRLRFTVDAPQLDRLGFGVAGQVAASGDLSGTFAQPDVALEYKAEHVVFGDTRLGHAQGHAELHAGANGALAFSTDASEIAVAGVEVSTLTARLSGTRAKHTLTASAKGKVHGQAVDVQLAANGALSDTHDGTRWTGAVTQLQNRGAPAIELEAPLAVSAGAGKVTLGATRLTLEGASLDLKSFDLDNGRIRSAGALTGVSLGRVLQLRQQLTGVQSNLKTDLVFDGDWDFSIGPSATGHVQIRRRSGDITVEVGRGLASLGISDINARAAFSGSNRLDVTAHAKAMRVGTLDVATYTSLVPRDGVLTIADESPLGGTIVANVPSLMTTGGLFGPGYLLDGHIALQLVLNGTVAQPAVSGSLVGDGISATLVDQGLQLKDGVVRVLLSHNLVDFQQVEFRGASGTLRATGRVRLDNNEPDLTASIVADKLELFASPDRQMSLSGSASIANQGQAGGLQINGKFTVDHALFDMPESPAPELSDDVVIVRPDGTTRGGPPPLDVAAEKAGTRPASRFAPSANIGIDLGHNFRFRGRGADLGLAGMITAMSEPSVPLRAVGNVRVTEGSTYTAFGRKIAIENGFFTFNGPVANPGINILAMRRNQQVEAGVQVTGTIQSPVVKLISEPTVPDNEKLSWLLFGHGTDQGNNLGQQSAMTTALALLGSASGKRIAQSVGLDEFSIGRSEVGLTDPQVVMIAKVINEWLVIGFEQGLQSAQNAVKATVNLSRYWSVSAYGGTFNGADVSYTRRFDRIGGR